MILEGKNMIGKSIKCGIQINPPAFIVIHKMNDKTKRKVMPLRNFKSNSNVKFIAADLMKRHCLNDIPQLKIEKNLRLLQEILKGVDKEHAIASVEKEFTIKVNEDLNKLPTNEIEFQKQLMDSIFEKNQIKQDNVNFVYDKQVDFDNVKETSNWDEDVKEDDFWD